jgi:hypothetical protein
MPCVRCWLKLAIHAPLDREGATIANAAKFAGVIVALAACTPSWGAQARPKPVKLENLPYAKARAVILSYGWKPVKGACGEAAADDPATCAKFPEIDRCLSSSPNMCIMGFENGRKSLAVFTRYGPPSIDGEGDTRVWYVEFHTKKGRGVAGR